jgi:hypothetical protein
MKRKALEVVRRMREKIIRMNQVVLSFPVWLTVGVSGLFKRGKKSEGWSKSEKNSSYGKMY